MSALLIGFSAYFFDSHEKKGDRDVDETVHAFQLDEDTLQKFSEEELQEADRAVGHITFRIERKPGQEQEKRAGEDEEGRMFGLRDLEWIYEPDPTSTLGDGVLSFRSGNRIRNIFVLEEDVPIAETLLRYGVEEFGQDFTIYDHNVDAPEANISYTEFSLEVNPKDGETTDERFLLKVRIDHVNDTYTIQNISNYDAPVALEQSNDADTLKEDLLIILQEKNELRRRIMALHEAHPTLEEFKKAFDELKISLSAKFEYDHFGEN